MSAFNSISSKNVSLPQTTQISVVLLLNYIFENSTFIKFIKY